MLWNDLLPPLSLAICDLQLISSSSAAAGQVSPAQAEILTPEALAFIAALHRTFDGTRKEVRSFLPRDSISSRPLTFWQLISNDTDPSCSCFSTD